MEEYNKEGKLLHAFSARTIRALVTEANKLKISREDVITVIKEGDYYVLLYYY